MYEIQVPDLASPIAFDFETIPNPDMIDKLPEPKPRANLKDPKKIAADIEEKKAEAVSKMDLNGNTALIASCGFAGIRQEDGEGWSDAVVLDPKGGEKDFLSAIWDVLMEAKTYITFNGMAFDVPMLLRRCLSADVIPPISIDTYKYGVPPKGNHYDLKEILGCHGSMPTGGLDFIAKMVLGEGKYDDDGTSGKSTEIGALWEAKEYEKIKERGKRDAELTLALWSRACGIYFPTPRQAAASVRLID